MHMNNWNWKIKYPYNATGPYIHKARNNILCIHHKSLQLSHLISSSDWKLKSLRCNHTENAPLNLWHHMRRSCGACVMCSVLCIQCIGNKCQYIPHHLCSLLWIEHMYNKMTAVIEQHVPHTQAHTSTMWKTKESCTLHIAWAHFIYMT